MFLTYLMIRDVLPTPKIWQEASTWGSHKQYFKNRRIFFRHGVHFWCVEYCTVHYKNQFSFGAKVKEFICFDFVKFNTSKVFYFQLFYLILLEDKHVLKHTWEANCGFFQKIKMKNHKSRSISSSKFCTVIFGSSFFYNVGYDISFDFLTASSFY